MTTNTPHPDSPLSDLASTHPMEGASLLILEWFSLFNFLKQQCWLPYGEATWDHHCFLNDESAIRTHLAIVDALKVLLIRYGEPLVNPPQLPGITPQLQRLAKGGLISQREIGLLIQTFRVGITYARHFIRVHKREKGLEVLDEPLGAIQTPQDILDNLDNQFEPDGHLKDSASPALGELRQQYRRQKDRIQQQMQRFTHGTEYRSALQSPVVTERDGRYVLPVRSSFKSQIPGVVHAGSGSGATLFIEPSEVIELNNRLQSLEQDIQDEEARLIQLACQQLEGEVPALMGFLDQLGWLDKHAAAARLSRLMDACPPEVPFQASDSSDSPEINLRKARHPLLVIQHLIHPQNRKIDVVPNDIHLGQSSENSSLGRTLIITGPNTGGKTVFLKTLGLCALMLRAGLHLPCADGSRMGLFHPVLADIGDAQDLTQSLSTFSGHIGRLNAFLGEATLLNRALILLDELCAGTDPTEGAALAKAVIRALHRRGATTVVTTHFGALKTEAYEQDGYLNASVEFDPENLKPTYRLLIGVPGASNAITIAQRLGLSETIIQEARQNLSTKVRESSELLEELEQKTRKAAEELQLAESMRKSAEDTYKRVEANRQEQETNKRQILQEFRQGLKNRLWQLDVEIKHLQKDLKQNQIHEDSLLHLKRLEQAADYILDDTDAELDKAFFPDEVPTYKIGEVIQSKRHSVTGEILAIQNDGLVIQAGLIKLTLPLNDVQRPGEKTKAVTQTRASGGGGAVKTPINDPGLECDLLGLHREEAMEKVHAFLDQVLLAGYQTVGIIHGQGSGVLKKAVREYLKEAPFVKRFRPAEAVDGGDGKTIVELS